MSPNGEKRRHWDQVGTANDFRPAKNYFWSGGLRRRLVIRTNVGGCRNRRGEGGRRDDGGLLPGEKAGIAATSPILEECGQTSFYSG